MKKLHIAVIPAAFVALGLLLAPLTSSVGRTDDAKMSMEATKTPAKASKMGAMTAKTPMASMPAMKSSKMGSMKMGAASGKMHRKEGKTVYSCPMHPDVLALKAGKCPKCGMALKAKIVAAVYTCPMHPEVLALKTGKCPKCGMALIKKK